MENNKEKLDKLKAKYMKVKKPLVILTALFSLVIILYVVIFTYKFIVLKKVFTINNQNALGNNFKRTVYTSDNIISHTTYYKDGVLRYNIGNYLDLYYIENKAYSINTYNLTYTVAEIPDDYIPGISLFNLDAVGAGQKSSKSATQNAFESLFENNLNIKKDFIENKEYLIISTENKDTFIDPNTFLVFKTNYLGTINYQIIEKNIVTDSEINLPNLNLYTKVSEY